MIQKVIQIGTSAGVTIPKSALGELGFKVGDDVAVTIDAAKKTVVIAARGSENHREDVLVAQSARDFVARYREALEKLADR